MATVQAIKELLIRARSEGVDKVAADLNKVAVAQKQVGDAALSAAKVTEDATRSQLSAAKAYERTAASIDPAFRAYQQMSRAQATFDRALAQGVIGNDQYAASLTRLQQRYAPLAAANNNLVGQTGNLAAQFNDIAVQLAGGQSPFLIAMQQGTQISQVLGGAGAGGAVKALGGAFLSLISPVNLLTIGAIAAGGALFQYFSGAGKETEKLDDKIKVHAELIKSIASAYGDAGKGLEEYAAQSGAVLEGQLRAQSLRLKAEMGRLTSEMYAGFSVATSPAYVDIASGSGFGGTDTEINSKFSAFKSAFDLYSESAARGETNVRGFREEVARVMKEAANNTALQMLGDELLKGSESAAKIEAQLRKAEQAIRLTSGAAAEGIGNLKEFNSSLNALSNIALPNKTDQQKALLELRKAMEFAGGREDRAAAQAAYDAALGRASERDAEKAAEQAQRQAEAEAKRREQTWNRAIDRAQDQTRALEQQAATYGMGAGEVARYRVEQELLNAAWEAGKADTPALRAQIAAMADQAGQAAERMEQLRQATEWDNFNKDTLKGFISDLRQGKSAADAFANALEKIADRLLDMTLDWAFGGQGSGGNPFAGLLGAITGGGSRANMAVAPGGSAAAFGGMGKLPDVITSAVEPLKAAANSVADVTRYATSGLRSQVESYVRDGALIRGMDPDIIAKGINQESGFNPFALGDGGKSHGVMQLYTGGGLGNVAQKQGISLDPSNWQQQVDFGLDYMKKNGHGEWYGFRDSGIKDPWAGIDRNGPQAFNGSAGNDNILGGMGSDMQELSGSFDTLSTSMSSATPQITQGLTGLTNITQQGGQNIGSALQDTAGTIAEGSNGVGSAIQQLMQSLSKGGGGGGLGGLLGLFSKGGGDWSDTGSWTIGSSMDGVGFTGLMHSGGLVGRDFSGRKNIHPAYFDDAPRYHSGLRPDEVPAILQQGEWVLSRDDVAAIRKGGAGNGGGGSSPPVVINNFADGTRVESRQERQSDGSMQTILDVVSDKVKGDMRRGARRNDSFSREVGNGEFRGRG